MKNSSPTADIFPERLRKARGHRRLSQSQLAGRAGLQASAVSHFETGARKPSFENLKKLADALDVTIDYLIGRTDELKGVAAADRLHRHIDALTTEDQELAEEILRTLAKRSRSQRGGEE